MTAHAVVIVGTALLFLIRVQGESYGSPNASHFPQPSIPSAKHAAGSHSSEAMAKLIPVPAVAPDCTRVREALNCTCQEACPSFACRSTTTRLLLPLPWVHTESCRLSALSERPGQDMRRIQ